MRKIAYALGTFVLLVAVCFVANLVFAMSGKEHNGGRPTSGENNAFSASYAAVVDRELAGILPKIVARQLAAQLCRGLPKLFSSFPLLTLNETRVEMD